MNDVMADSCGETCAYAVDIALSALYGILCLGAIVYLMRLRAASAAFSGNTSGLSAYGSWFSRKACLTVISFACVFRMTYFVILALTGPTPHYQQAPWVALIQSFPAFMFVMVEMIMIFFYAELNHYARNLGPSKMFKPLLLSLIGMIVIVMIVLYSLLFVFQNADEMDFQTLIIIFLAFLFVCCAFGFSIFGVSLYMRVRQFPVLAGRRKELLRKVGWVTMFSVTCFTLRAVLILLQVRFQWFATSMFVVTFYFVCLECAPLTCLLWVLSSSRSRSTNNDGSSTLKISRSRDTLLPKSAMPVNYVSTPQKNGPVSRSYS